MRTPRCDGAWATPGSAPDPADETPGGPPPSKAPMGPNDGNVTAAWWALRLGLGIGVLLAGVDKFFDRLAVWSMYLSPLAERLLPVSDTTFLRIAGVGEAALGLAILTRWTRLGGYLLSAWLLGIVL